MLDGVLGRVSEVRDQQFMVAASGDLLRGVGEFNGAGCEPPEERPDLGHIVQRKNELGAQLAEPLRHHGELLRLQVVAVKLNIVVRRVEIEQTRGPVVTGEHFFVGQTFDLDARQAVVRLFDERRNAFRVESRRRVHAHGIVAVADKPPSHSFAHLSEFIRSIGESWAGGKQALMEKRAVEARRVREQLQQLIRMKIEELITDDEFRAQRILLEGRLAELEGGTPENETKPESVLNDLNTISMPLMHLANAWERVPTCFKRRFQHITLPAGYVFGRVGTAQKGRLLSFLHSPLPVYTNVVRPVGFEPTTSRV